MARVSIDSGPVDATDFLHSTPRPKWDDLLRARRMFLATRLPHDCRKLLEFVRDGEQMYGPMGFSSLDDFIVRGLKLDPQEVAWAIEGLRRMEPNEAIPDEAIPYARAQELGKQGRPKKGEENIAIQGLKYGTRDHWLARLDRDGHAELAARVRAGMVSANAAAIEAGFRKCPTALETARKAIGKLTDAEWQELWAEEEARRKTHPRASHWPRAHHKEP